MSPPATPPFAAVLLLAGGDGRRMGTPKAEIRWRGAPLLVHVAERLEGLAPLTLVATRADRSLPEGPWRRVDDEVADAGPLAGLAAGLAAAAETSPGGFVAVAACDYPFADAALYRVLLTFAEGVDVALPRHGGHAHPLQAVWRAGAGSACAAALSEGERRVRAALDRLTVREVAPEDLPPGIDPARALLNLNHPSDLERARSLSRTPGGPRSPRSATTEA